MFMLKVEWGWELGQKNPRSVTIKYNCPVLVRQSNKALIWPGVQFFLALTNPTLPTLGALSCSEGVGRLLVEKCTYLLSGMGHFLCVGFRLNVRDANV